MVLKPMWLFVPENTRFENDVKIYGIKTVCKSQITAPTFENDVKIYGIKTSDMKDKGLICLRMM